MKKIVLIILYITVCSISATEFDPDKVILTDEMYTQMALAIDKCCTTAEQYLPDYDKNNFYLLHQRFLKDLKSQDYEKRVQSEVQEAQKRLKSFNNTSAQRLYEQAVTYNTDEAWELFIEHMMTEYKKSLVKNNFMSFPSLKKKYQDLILKMKEHFEANKDINLKCKIPARSIYCACYLLKQHKKDWMDNIFQDCLK